MGLKVKEMEGFVLILNSKRKTRFIGFVEGLNSIILLYIIIL
jgi:hypothetical protein